MSRSNAAGDGQPHAARTRLVHSAAAALLVAAVSFLAAGSATAGPDVGEPAPAFTLAGSDGKDHSLSDLLEEHEGVVLAWFPKAFTPG